MRFDDRFIIKTKEDMEEIVKEAGILPLFTNSIPGFSVEEHVDPSVWFTDEPGPWEWKGPIIGETGCAYGKLFERKAAFVRPDLFFHLCNFRRDGYDFDARFDDGLASFRERDLFELVDLRATALSRDLKAEGGWGKDGKKGFDTLITALQMKCYVLIEDFAYDRDKSGKPYGWGVSVYTTPEKFFGAEKISECYRTGTEKSRKIVAETVAAAVPYASDRAVMRFVG